jgi:hypothetical protein
MESSRFFLHFFIIIEQADFVREFPHRLTFRNEADFDLFGEFSTAFMFRAPSMLNPLQDASSIAHFDFFLRALKSCSNNHRSFSFPPFSIQKYESTMRRLIILNQLEMKNQIMKGIWYRIAEKRCCFSPFSPITPRTLQHLRLFLLLSVLSLFARS